MVQLHFRSGNKIISAITVHRFPFTIGRSASADLSLDEPGIWDQHFEISLDPDGFKVRTFADTFVILNGVPVQKNLLANGDLLEIGSIKCAFSLSPNSQKSLAITELLTWTGLIFLCATQFFLLYWLPG